VRGGSAATHKFIPPISNPQFLGSHPKIGLRFTCRTLTDLGLQ
jgi:hypothetical protein